MIQRKNKYAGYIYNSDSQPTTRLEYYVDQDEEYEDMDLITSANKDDELQGDDSHDDLEGDDNHDDLEDSDTELAQDKLHFPESEKAIEISNTKKRGPTMLHLVHTRRVDEREIIICNEFGQPVGPVTKEKDVVGKFSRFLGTIARNNNYAPLIHTSWKKVPNKDKIWEYVLKKYDVPNAAKTWVLKTIGHAYKVHKSADFTQLLRMWNNKDVANRSLRAKENRMSQKNMHTAGPKSFARIREEMRNDDPNKELPDLCKMFERTRKRTEGRAYLDTYDDTASKIEQMKNYKPSEDGNASVDPFRVVMNKEHHGYVRLYGRGVTKTMMKKMDGVEEKYMLPGGLMESFKASMEVEKTEMKKEIEEDYQKKKAELEAMQIKLKNVLEKLPIEVVQDLDL
ncbi:hypothetical protein SSX86_003172 [Deinandra increscens subsp. villosa]|uniref:Transposase, Ptta/En/Spm, plant n=1 Tax=Deinandra increscens subsp. villosa TaxID=3103831 RepID=A0AAP0DKT7_9ASTR